MSIKLPRSLKIGPFHFSVKRVACIKRKEAVWGETNHWVSAIKIKRSLSVQNQAVVLMHEIIHASLWICQKYELNHDEVFVDQLAKMLIDTLWNSPGLLRYLKEAKK